VSEQPVPYLISNGAPGIRKKSQHVFRLIATLYLRMDSGKFWQQKNEEIAPIPQFFLWASHQKCSAQKMPSAEEKR
jgi:hypothetical protein